MSAEMSWVRTLRSQVATFMFPHPRRRFPMVRVAIGGIEHETAGVLPGTKDLDYFRRKYFPASELLKLSGDANTVTQGFLGAAWKRGWDVAPLPWYKGTSSAPASREAFDAMLAELLSDLEAAGPVDGVLLSLHGGFSTREHADADGEVLRAVRAKIGPSVPLMAVHDMHCNLTEAVIGPADAVAVFRTYPHVDMAERAEHIAPLVLQP